VMAGLFLRRAERNEAEFVAIIRESTQLPIQSEFLSGRGDTSNPR
jgi:hypothetical protein